MTRPFVEWKLLPGNQDLRRLVKDQDGTKDCRAIGQDKAKRVHKR